MTSILSTADGLNAALGLIIITDLALLGAERQRLSIRLIANQGVLLGLVPVLAYNGTPDLYLIAVSAIFLIIKGVILPLLLRRTHRQLPSQQLPKPYLGYSACALLGIIGFALSLWIGGRLGIAANPLFSQVFPIGMATIFTGLLLIVSRKEVLSQLFGYLVLENGIFLLGAPMAEQESFWLELSILLDIMVAVFVMGIAIHHINRAFHSTYVDHIASLKD